MKDFSRKRHEINFLNENGCRQQPRNLIYKAVNALTSCHISNSQRNPITYQTGPKNDTEQISIMYFSLTKHHKKKKKKRTDNHITGYIQAGATKVFATLYHVTMN